MVQRKGFTLVELLVVIAIIGVLISLLLPAVQSARESARRVQCVNHLKQVALASLVHVDRTKHLPSGGWGYIWVGDPDQGTGQDQPGGYFYNALPFLEQQTLYDLGKGLGHGRPNNDKGKLALQMIQTPLGMLSCPSKRQAKVFAVRASRDWMVNTLKPPSLEFGWYRSCYKVNAGSNPVFYGTGPGDWNAADKMQGFQPDSAFAQVNGVAHQRSMIRLAQIEDGTSNTYMVGDKYLNPDNYESGNDFSDDEPALGADDYDLHGWGHVPPARDTPGLALFWSFGGAHPGGFNMALCDGSVRGLRYELSADVHRRLANREDGQPISESEL
ncbi:MAG: DUF1559 domain-containing protein [Pirellulales bacterium]